MELHEVFIFVYLKASGSIILHHLHVTNMQRVCIVLEGLSQHWPLLGTLTLFFKRKFKI